jgi:hypothetical protein
LTPTKNESILIEKAGTYWIQAEVRAGGDTINLYNTIKIEAVNSKQTGFDLGLPGQQIMILIALGAIVALAGLVISRR